jgi:hypothetical protein
MMIGGKERGREQGKPFKADIAIIDQFGNEHWLNGMEFPYLA